MFNTSNMCRHILYDIYEVFASKQGQLHVAPWSNHVASQSDYEMDSAGQNQRRKSFKNTVIKKESSPVWASRPLAGSLGQHTVQPILSTES